MRPSSNYILLEVEKEKNTSTIIRLEKSLKREPFGIVLAIGDCVEADIEIGQKVYYTQGGMKDTEWGLLIPERSMTLI